MCTFYYPKFNANEEPVRMKTSEEFIIYYRTAYYNDCGYKVKGTKRNVGQNSRYVENIIDELLKKTDKYDERDLVRILSWKIGKIKQIKSENEFINCEGSEKLKLLLNEVSDLADSYSRNLSDRYKYKKAYEKYITEYNDIFKATIGKHDSHIIYANKWLPINCNSREGKNFSDISCFPFVGAFGNKLGISELIKKIMENKDLDTITQKEKVQEEDAQEVLNALLVKNNKGEDAIKGIGTVYLLTVLYFLSNGDWPIYDRFADKALKAICENKKPGDSINADILPGKNGYVNNDIDDIFGNVIKKHIKCYKNRIKRAFNGYENYKENRDIDRALWVYGHLFPDVKK